MSHLLSHPLCIKAQSLFQKTFGHAPNAIVHAPGRFNLIGEHTDYNHGYVLPGAIEQGICFAMDIGSGPEHEWFAADTDELISLPVTSSTPTYKGWVDYFLGAYRILSDHIALPAGVRIVFTSDLPAGAGLSSSSALTCGFLLGLNALLELKKTREELAWLAHLVERNFIGLQGGIMDQHACLLCEPDKLLLLDCFDRTYAQIAFPVDAGIHLFLIDTRVQHRLTDSDYNTRASECRQALAILQSVRDIRSLREATYQDLRQHAALLGPVLTQRVDFVLRENARVLSVVECIRQHDYKQLGRLLYQSHAGLRDDYKVSCAELDFLVDAISASPDILGARMMGGGFGGCTINLATRPMDAVFRDALQRSYVDRFGRECAFIDITPSSGAMVEVI